MRAPCDAFRSVGRSVVPSRRKAGHGSSARWNGHRQALTHTRTARDADRIATQQQPTTHNHKHTRDRTHALHSRMSANSDSSLSSGQLEAMHMVDMPSVTKLLGLKLYKHSGLETVIYGQLHVTQGRFPLEVGAPTRLTLTYITRTMTIVWEKDGLSLSSTASLCLRTYTRSLRRSGT
eukprot:6211490-Pleurochrysis_carterae.AAC.1